MVLSRSYSHKAPFSAPKSARGGFTFLEVVIAVGLISIGVATSLTALTKINSFASMSRNATGAYTVCQNQIDAILSNGPFNPQKTNFDGTVQVPPELVLDSTRGGPLVTPNVAVYQDPVTGVVVSGTLTTSVTDGTITYYGTTMYMYNAMVTVTYKYLNRTYTYSMSTVRASDI